MTSVSIRKNDQVRVTVGRDRGKEGRVLKVLVDTGRAIVEGVNRVKRHTRPNPAKNIKGGIVEREASLHISNLMVICPGCSKPTRVKKVRGEDGRATRFCKHCNSSVERKESA